MKVGIFGSGRVGQTLGSKISGLGHDVMLGTRDPGKLSDWHAKAGVTARVGTLADTAAFGEILFNSTNGNGSLNALALAGGSNLGGKVLIEASNVFDFKPGQPPMLSIANTDSLAEQIQRSYPNVKVVKACNTLAVNVLINPGQVADGDHTLFVCGNDADAKGRVMQLLSEWFGWQSIIDLGDISAARAMEMYMILWLRLKDALGTGLFNIKVVR